MDRWSVWLLAFMAAGCAQKREYQVTVHNRLDVPITVGLIKEGPPLERDWASVEQMAIAAHGDEVPPWGMVIPAGRRAESPMVPGSFERGARAMLRVYRGEHSNAELMAISDGSPDRATLTLFPGNNELLVAPGEKSLMTVRRVGR